MLVQPGYSTLEAPWKTTDSAFQSIADLHLYPKTEQSALARDERPAVVESALFKDQVAPRSQLLAEFIADLHAKHYHQLFHGKDLWFTGLLFVRDQLNKLEDLRPKFRASDSDGI